MELTYKLSVTPKTLKERKASYAKLAKDIGITPAYARMIILRNLIYNPNQELIDKIEEWSKKCHCCGKKIET